MAKQTINIGTNPNDGTGDTLREFANKSNLNFNEIYTQLGEYGLADLFEIEKDVNGDIIKITALYDFKVPPQSIEVGNSLKISDLAQILSVVQSYDNKKKLILAYEIGENYSNRPEVKKIGEPTEFTLQPIDTTTKVFTDEVSFNILSQQDVMGEIYELKIYSDSDIRLKVFRFPENGGKKTLLVDRVFDQSVLDLNGTSLTLAPIVDFEIDKLYELNFTSTSDITIKGLDISSISGFDTYTSEGIGLTEDPDFVPYVKRLKGWEYNINKVAYVTDFDQDFTNVNGSSKSDLSLPTQPKTGLSIKAISNGNILNGQPVIWNYDSGTIKVTTPGALPSQADVTGIAIKDSLDGEEAEILVYGVCTTRRTSKLIVSEETVLLNSANNGSIRSLTDNTTFKDSGGDSDYDSSENYFITFDAGDTKTVDITVNDFEFEHSAGGTSMYDRLGIQVSNDNINYTNVSVSWMFTSDDPTPPYDSTRLGSSDGYIFPKDSTGLVGEVINTGTRYVRFYFKSDSSTEKLGWDLTLTPDTPYGSVSQPLPPGSKLYLDNNYPSTLLNETSNSNILYGFSVGDDVDNDSVLMRIYKPKPIV